MKYNIDLKKVYDKYLELAGESPEHDFWGLLAVCGIDVSNEALQEFYENMEDYVAGEGK